MMISRGALQDLHVEDGRSAVFIHDQVIVLSEIATAILEATPTTGSVSLAEITDAVVDIYGIPEPPLDAADVTQEQVLQLVAHKVLQMDSADDPERFTPDSVQALRDALRHIVSDSRELWALPDGVTAQQFASAAERHRVAPTVAKALNRLDIPARTKALLGATAAQEDATVAVMGAELVEIVNGLERAGVRVLAFKGLALAVQAHGDVGARGTGDHDLLVPPSDLERAYSVLLSLGWAPTGDLPSPGDSWAWRYFVRTGYELSLKRRGHVVDLHWYAGPVRTAFPTFDELWVTRTRVDVHGCDVPTLSPYDALAHSASHSAKDHWRWLRGLLDVYLLASDPEAWQGADRPLEHDQLLSLGLAVRMLGVPTGAPDVVKQAAHFPATYWDTAILRQAGPSDMGMSTRAPGFGLLQTLTSRRRGGATISDLSRQVSRSIVPLAYVAEGNDRSAFVAVPRVLGRRTKEVLALWRQAARSALR